MGRKSISRNGEESRKLLVGKRSESRSLDQR